MTHFSRCSDKEDDNPFMQKFQRSSRSVVTKTKSSTASRKNPQIVVDDDIDEADMLEAVKNVDLPSHTSPPSKKTKTNPSPHHSSSPVKSPGKPTSSYREYLQRKATGPTAPGSKEIPEGAPDCLVGYTFVFTGELSSLSREDAQDLVKRYGGRVTGAPSGRTDFVVVGEGAGASKLKKVEDLGIRTLDEDGLLELIRKSQASSKKAVPVFSAKEIVPPTPEKKPRLPPITPPAPMMGEAVEAQLWTTKYAPQSEADLIGNHTNYERLVQWLRSFSSTPGNGERAVLISGPPGIGKTTSAHLACREAGMEIVEMNASDTRSKANLHDHVREMIDTRSITGFSDFFSKKENSKGGADHHQRGKPRHEYRQQVLIMDEVDGMSAGDRGGMAELIQLIKKTHIPIICICNDRSSPKVRSLANYCLDLRFRRPDARSVLPRITAIAQKEGLELGVNAVEELVQSTHGDIRQILNILSTFKLTGTRLDFDTSKRWGGTGSRKDVELGPFDAVPALLGSGFNRMSLSERLDMYFVDSSLVPLMIHENYLRSQANTGRTIKGDSGGHSFMELYAAAAESLSESDLVEGLIRGANQEWSLAPLHAAMSTVRPAYYCHGAMTGRVEFASWLGQYSKGQKNNRLVGELTRHSYLRTRTGRRGMRLCYLSRLAQELLRPLQEKGLEGVDETISILDEYDLTREDLDSILELMVNPTISTTAYGRLPTAIKTALTRKYNQGVHKLPYAMGESGTVIVRKVTDEMALPKGGEMALDEEETALLAGGNGDDDDNNSQDPLEDVISKDKMIKARSVGTGSGKGSRGSGSSGGRGRGTRGRGRGRGKATSSPS